MKSENSGLNITPEITVGEVVANNYNAAGVFRQYGMDFCCGGGITLQKACEKKKVDLSVILDELKKLDESFSSSENYRAWEPEFLIDHIINTHHRFVRMKTEEIMAYAEKVARVHGGHRPENIAIYQKFSMLVNELMDHLEDEEETVFPLIKNISQKRKKGVEITERELNELKKQLGLMIGDHDGAGRLIEEIRTLSNNFTPPEDACATYRILYQNLDGFEKDLHKHVHLENNILFKKAEDLVAS